MSRAGRKGRIPNELVAASCAAIIAVYAAGSWRTRDEAKRFTVEGQMRRPVRPAAVPVAPTPDPVAASSPAVEQVAGEPQPSVTTSLKAEVATSVPSVAVSQAIKAAIPTAPVVTAVVSEEKSEAGPVVAVAPEETETAPAHNPWLDGYYTGWGTSRHGDIQAFVTIKDGRIVNSGIATCETRYPCYVIDQIIPQPIDLQSPDVDRVSRATESGDAYYWGLVKALENAETGTFRSSRP